MSGAEVLATGDKASRTLALSQGGGGGWPAVALSLAKNKLLGDFTEPAARADATSPRQDEK
jgi:hypothetical protein